MHIRPELPSEVDQIRAVNDAAFGQSVEGAVVDRLRVDGLVIVSLVAVVADRVIGHILFSRLPIDTVGGVVPALAPALARPLRSPFSGDAFMALELQPAALAGIEGDVRYPPAFSEVS